MSVRLSAAIISPEQRGQKQKLMIARGRCRTAEAPAAEGTRGPPAGERRRRRRRVGADLVRKAAEIKATKESA